MNRRCRWCNEQNPLYVAYHDAEWGVPCHDDRMLFELLILESFQAGLSWECVLNKREAFRNAFDGFDWDRIAAYGEKHIADLLANPGIIRNRLKVRAAIRNAAVFRDIRSEFGSFDAYLTLFTGKRIIIEHGKTTSPLSDALSADLRRRGMRFVGSTIIYAYLQAIGAINGHEPGCALYHGGETMPRIAYLTDAEVLGTKGLSAARPRLTARAVVIGPDNRIAVMHAAKYGIHTLPGGGVEEGESVTDALVREITEETGCRIDSFEPLGYVEENRFHADYTQLSYYYIVRTQDSVLRPHLTGLEAENGTSAMWCTPEEAFDRISKPVFDRPQGKFLQARDMAALRMYRTRTEVTVVRVVPEDADSRSALADYAQRCPWAAGPHLAGMLRENRFTDWEAVFAARRNGEIIGYCTFLKTDYYPENRYWPWISTIFVDETQRGQGVCGLLIAEAIEYARGCGFHRVYIPSDMTGFYERYGFERIDELRNYGGDVDHIFARDV